MNVIQRLQCRVTIATDGEPFDAPSSADSGWVATLVDGVRALRISVTLAGNGRTAVRLTNGGYPVEITSFAATGSEDTKTSCPDAYSLSCKLSGMVHDELLDRTITALMGKVPTALEILRAKAEEREKARCEVPLRETIAGPHTPASFVRRVSATHVQVSLADAPDVIKVGKLKTSHVVFDFENIARMHAVIERWPEGWAVLDLGSLAGTRVNGQPVDKNARVSVGDRLEFGECVLELIP